MRWCFSHIVSKIEFVRLGQADHSDLPVQVNLNGAFVWCARADQTDLLLWVENHHPHTVQSHCTATVATQRKMGHTMEMQNLMEIPKMAAPLPQSQPKTS